MLRTKIFAACLICLMAAPVYAAGGCKLGVVATLPITMDSLRPTLTAKINGRDAQFVLDSGAFYSTMSSASAAEFNLKLTATPFGFRINGIGGSTGASVATVKEFTIVGVALKNLEFLVGGSTVGGAGLLGQNFLQKFDVEYDLAGGVIRLFRTDDCEKSLLAYWLKPGQSYSSMHVDAIDPHNPHTMGRAYINGKEIRVAFDTGAFTSILATSAAARAGVKLDSPGVVESGYSRGLGRGQVKSYIAPFASFKIGDGEEIQNTKLRIADIDLNFTDMLLGADFFISHRIFVANKEHRIFFTYNGGPVFNLSKRPESPVAAATLEQGDKSVPDAAAKATAESTGTDAAEIARRGAALAARQQFAPAIAELTKAIELTPDEPEYYFQRANAHWRNGEADLALQDFDRVIMLKRDFLPAYIPRAELRFAKKDMEAGLADLDAVDQLAPKPADLRFMLAELYQRLEHFPAAINQYTWWIKYHEDDSRMVAALRGRCLSSALQNQDLPTALSDCNTALRHADKKNPNYAHLWVDRGFVRLRQGDYDRAAGDFNEAIKVMPANALAFYGRAVVEARKGNKTASDSDLAKANELAPKLAERYQKFGIAP